jgi:hypothetical protein
MTPEVAPGRGRHAQPHVLTVSKRFGRYKDEDEKAVRAPDVIEDQTLRQLREAWLNVRLKDGVVATYYARALKQITGISYSSANVEKFSVALAEFQNEDHFRLAAGLFLSALINNCKDNDFVINTGHFSEGIDALGYKNTKNLTVVGDVGNFLGDSMQCGTITVEGNAGGVVGAWMTGGEIHIDGSYRYLSENIISGKIYHKGKLIFEK